MKGRQLFGKLASDWPEARLESLLEPAVRPVTLEADEEYVPLGLRAYGLGFFKKESAKGADLSATESDFFIVHEGDFVFSGQFSWEGAVGLASREENGCLVSHRYPVFRVRTDKINPRYLLYFFRSPAGRFLLRENSFGAAGRNRPLNIVRLLKEMVPIPPKKTQEAIVALLDKKLAAIGNLLRTRFDLVTKRNDLIYTAVTQGLSRKTALKPSGISTIPQIPAHWPVVRNKSIIHEVIELSETGEEELLSVSHLTGVTPRSERTVTMFLAESNVGYKRVRKGDLVINTMWAWMGALGVSPADGIVSPAYGVYRLDTTKMIPGFYDLFYRSRGYIAEMTKESKGIWSSRLRLYPESFLNLRSPVPPIDEQKEIVARLNTVSFDRKIEIANEKLAEYRDALIGEVLMNHRGI